MKKKIILSLLLITILVMVGCQKEDKPAEEVKSETTAEGIKTEEKPAEEAPASDEKLVLVGSTSVTPAAEALGEAFRAKEGIQVEVQGVGSGAGIKAAKEKTADIGMSSRNLKDEEKDFGLTETILAHDGIAASLLF